MAILIEAYLAPQLESVMPKIIPENEVVRISLLMTDAMLHTVPPKSKVVESLGHRKIMNTDRAGVLLSSTPLAEGYHMVVELTARELGLWLKEYGEPFWMWSPELNKFQRFMVEVETPNNKGD